MRLSHEYTEDPSTNVKFNIPLDELRAEGSNFIKNGKIHFIVMIHEHIQAELQQKSVITAVNEFLPAVVAEQFETVTFKCADGISLRAFNNVISAKSDVFRAMFENEMQEKQNKEVKIIDFDSVVMTELLKFIYTGVASDFSKIDMKLYEAAEVYMVEGLKEVCVESMKVRLKIDNTAEMEFADLHDEKDLYELCLFTIYAWVIIFNLFF